MKILVAHIDGLFVENPDAVPNTDPLMEAVQFVRQLVSGEIGSVMLTTARADPGALGPWLAQYDIKAQWIRGVPYEPVERIQRTLSEIGRIGGRISYYITTDAGAALAMAGHGIPSVQFRSSGAVMDYRPKTGGRWSEVYEAPEEQPDEEEDEDDDDITDLT